MIDSTIRCVSGGNRTPLLNQIKSSRSILVSRSLLGTSRPMQGDRIQTLTGHRYDLAVHKGVEPLSRGRQPRILTVVLMD